MRRYLIRRLLLLVASIVVASFAIFSSSRLIPGNPLIVITQGRIKNPVALAKIRQEFRLGEPLFSGYWSWITHGLRGDFGTSIVYHESVIQVVDPRILTTVLLVAYATVLVMTFGSLLGAIAALKPGIIDKTVLVGTTIGVGIPGFVAAVFLLLVFAVVFPLFPSYGAGSGSVDRLFHLTLPAIALALSSVGLSARVTRIAMRGEMQQEHVQTAISRGLTRSQVVRRHVIRNSLVALTGVGGVTIAYLVVGSVVIENAFELNGLGTLLINSMVSDDFAVVQYIVLLLVVFFMLLNSAMDVIYILIDPRIRLT